MEVPLFDRIDRQGDTEVPIENKLAVIFSPEDLMRRLQVDSHLCNQVEDIAYRLRPLNTLILGRKPQGKERKLFEGRGAYHKDIPITPEESATIYVKGSGNEKAFDQRRGMFTGFPSEPDKLFFDDLILSPHPRELGTETARWALMEAINATFIFAGIAQKHAWNDITQALQAGVSIPLNVMHQIELSSYLFTLLEQYKKITKDVVDKKALEWEGNAQLASISLLVPNHKRIAGGIDKNAEETNELVGRLTNPNIAKTAGRTLRTLVEMGFCYSIQSSHGQNLYDEGLMAQADNSDLVTLGDYHGTSLKWTTDKIGRTVYLHISSRDQQVALLFSQFERPDLLTPLHHPFMNPAIRITWEQVAENQEAFWQEILTGIAKPHAIEKIVRLMPFMRTEINMAAALLLVDSSDQNAWSEMASEKLEVLAQYEDQYGVVTEYQKKLEANLPDESEPYFLQQLVTEGRLHAQVIIDFLKTGNIQSLENDPILGKAVELQKRIEEIKDQDDRDEILELCSACFSSRGSVYHFFEDADLVARFKGDHYDLLSQLIKQERYEDAKAITKTLIASQNVEIADYYPLMGGYEIGEDRYPRLVLEKEADYKEIYERAKYDLYVSSFARRTQPFDLLRIFRDVMNQGKVLPQSLNLKEYAVDHSLALPKIMIRGILGSFEENKETRKKITDWIERYLLKFDQHSELEDRFGQEGMIIIGELEDMTNEIGNEIPELAFAHQCIFAPILAESHPEKAEEYFQEGKNYYDISFSERAQLSKVNLNPDGIMSKVDREYASKNDAIAHTYCALGYPIIARNYRNRAQNKHLEPSW